MVGSTASFGLLPSSPPREAHTTPLLVDPPPTPQIVLESRPPPPGPLSNASWLDASPSPATSSKFSFESTPPPTSTVERASNNGVVTEELQVRASTTTELHSGSE